MATAQVRQQNIGSAMCSHNVGIHTDSARLSPSPVPYIHSGRVHQHRPRDAFQPYPVHVLLCELRVALLMGQVSLHSLLPGGRASPLVCLLQTSLAKVGGVTSPASLLKTLNMFLRLEPADSWAGERRFEHVSVV